MVKYHTAWDCTLEIILYIIFKAHFVFCFNLSSCLPVLLTHGWYKEHECVLYRRWQKTFRWDRKDMRLTFSVPPQQCTAWRGGFEVQALRIPLQQKDDPFKGIVSRDEYLFWRLTTINRYFLCSWWKNKTQSFSWLLWNNNNFENPSSNPLQRP